MVQPAAKPMIFHLGTGFACRILQTQARSSAAEALFGQLVIFRKGRPKTFEKEVKAAEAPPAAQPSPNSKSENPPGAASEVLTSQGRTAERLFCGAKQ